MSSIQERYAPLVIDAMLVITAITVLVGITLFGIWIMTPTQDTCNTVYNNEGEMHSLWIQVYINTNQCMYDQNGSYVVNPNYSIWQRIFN